MIGENKKKKKKSFSVELSVVTKRVKMLKIYIFEGPEVVLHEDTWACKILTRMEEVTQLPRVS